MAAKKRLNLEQNHLFYGDCLENLRFLPDECIDLIYLDPPFKSDTDYNMLFGSEAGGDTAQIKAFEDTWYWKAEHDGVYRHLLSGQTSVGQVIEAMHMLLGPCGMLAYVLFMTERLVELKRVLKETGSLYLHCDPSASHYLKLILDAVFGTKMFKNEVIWHYRRWTAGNRNFQRMHDVIFRYTKTDKFKFNVLYEPYGEWIKKDYSHVDEKTGKRWRWHTVKGKRAKVFLEDENRGVKLNDVWQIPYLGSTAKERLGYPTQKPLALLRRIIEATSDQGDIVLDPFCGCGTTVDAAHALGRRWIGIDISALAVNVIRARLEDVYGDEVMTDVEVTGIPTSLDAARMLLKKDPLDFERWAVGLIQAKPNDRQIGDAGSDGLVIFPARKKGRTQRGIVSVKGGQTINPGMVRDLLGTVDAMKAVMGVLILMKQPTRGMIDEAAKAGIWVDEITERSFPKVQIITVENLLNGKKPDMPTPLRPYSRANYSHRQQGELYDGQ